MHINKIFTHIDFDGAAGAVVASLLNPAAEIFSLNNSEADATVLENVCSSDILIIVDLPLKKETIVEVVNRVGACNVVYADHHVQSEAIKLPSCWFDRNECGASLLYKILPDVDPGFTAYKTKYDALADFVRYARDYDLWHHNYPESRKFDSLLKVMGFASFVQRFKEDSSTTFRPEEEFALECFASNVAAAVERNKTEFYPISIPGIDASGVYTFVHSNVNELLNTILQENPDIDFAISFNMASGTASVRSKVGTTYAHDIAAKYNGGGHPRAAGFTFASPADKHDFIQSLFQ